MSRFSFLPQLCLLISLSISLTSQQNVNFSNSNRREFRNGGSSKNTVRFGNGGGRPSSSQFERPQSGGSQFGGSQFGGSPQFSGSQFGASPQFLGSNSFGSSGGSNFGSSGRPTSGGSNFGSSGRPTSGGSNFGSSGRPTSGGSNFGTSGLSSLGGSRPSRLPHSNALSIRGCFCIPSNQVCNPNGIIPRGSTKIDKVKTRIVNTAPDRTCAQDEKPCCFATGGNIPKPTLPKPPPGLEHCGNSQSLYAGRAGTGEADFGEYPWMAAIVSTTDDFVGTGVLIHPQWVLTAAHKLQTPAELTIRLGDYDLAHPREYVAYPHQTFGVSQIVFHPHFNPSNLFNDIALIRLSRPIQSTPSIQPVCLPFQKQRFNGKRCWVSGWGVNTRGEFSGIMREVDVPVIDEVDCQFRLRDSGELGSAFKLNSESFVCAGGERGKDACRGDGGAPLVCEEFDGKFTVLGLVAWGLKTCGQEKIPGVYINVPSFREFIDSQLYGSRF